jgi:hypothetical protein
VSFLFAGHPNESPRDEDTMAANIPPRQHNVRAHSSPVDVSPTIAGSKGVPTLDPAPVSTSPGPASQRKHIVLPDPVAFK